MRHNRRRHLLGVTGPHRFAMLGNLCVAIITHGRIKTTLAKAKALRPFIEKIITLAKKAHSVDDAARKLHFRRLAISRVRDKKAVAELFDNKVTEFIDRSGGYTRIYKLGQRVGDAAEMALIEFIDASDKGYEKPKRKPEEAKEEVTEEAKEEVTEEAKEEVTEEAKEEVTEEAKEEVTEEAKEK